MHEDVPNVYCLQDVQECLMGMREYDVPYHVRFAIDTGKHTVAYLLNVSAQSYKSHTQPMVPISSHKQLKAVIATVAFDVTPALVY